MLRTKAFTPLSSYRGDISRLSCFHHDLPVSCLEAAQRSKILGFQNYSPQELQYFAQIDAASLSRLGRFKQFESLKSTLMPPLLQEINKINTVIQDYFDIASTNVSSLETASVICLGEDHLRNADIKQVGKTIEALRVHVGLSGKAQLVLLETAPPFPAPLPIDEEQTHRQEHSISPSMPVSGWDDASLHNKMKFLLLHFSREKALQELFHTLRPRHLSLCDSIAKALKTYDQVIVVGGYSHFSHPTHSLDPWAERLREIVPETLTHLHIWPHAVLIPKSRNIT